MSGQNKYSETENDHPENLCVVQEKAASSKRQPATIILKTTLEF